jgi:hypothetical protein
VPARNLSWKTVKQYLKETGFAKTIELRKKSGFTPNIALSSLLEEELSAENWFLFVGNTKLLQRN